MNDELQRRLKNCGNLPTLPGVAIQILQLCQDPNADLYGMAEAISHDPALSAAILRIVNSAYYGLSREIATLDHAVRLLGIDKIRTLALSFSIVGALRRNHKIGNHLSAFWRRSLISGVAARSLVRWAKTYDEEALVEAQLLQGTGATGIQEEVLFLAALLQDIGVLVLAEALSVEYEKLLAQSKNDHFRLVELEKEHLGLDHGEVGRWMAQQWHLPEVFELAFQRSHQPHQIEVAPEFRVTVQVVALSGLFADIWVMEGPTVATQYAMANAREMLDMDEDSVGKLLRTIAESLPEMSSLFRISVGDAEKLKSILEQAQETLLQAGIQISDTPESIEIKPGMNDAPDRTLRETLFDLATAAEAHVHQSISSNRVAPDGRIRCLRKKIDDPSSGAWHVEEVFKDQWFKVAHALCDEIKQLDLYSEARDSLPESSQHDPSSLDSFTLTVVSDTLSHPQDASEIQGRVDSFIAELQGHPPEFKATVELRGLVVSCPVLEFHSNGTQIALRKAEVSDLEKEYLAETTGQPKPAFPEPSAILSLEAANKSSAELQIMVQQALAILRLFGVGSVHSPCYSIECDSVTTPFSGIWQRNETVSNTLEYTIQNAVREELSRFWKSITRVLPRGFYDPSQSRQDHRTIAYQHYCDALFESSLVERRVSSVIMGLESLYSSADSELAYRLRTSVSKVLSLFGHEAIKVKRIIKDAYGIKGSFVRGDLLSAKRRRKLENHYGDLEVLASSVLDYLRLSILICLQGTWKKQSFIQAIEDSLVDSEQSRRLASLIRANAPDRKGKNLGGGPWTFHF